VAERPKLGVGREGGGGGETVTVSWLLEGSSPATEARRSHASSWQTRARGASLSVARRLCQLGGACLSVGRGSSRSEGEGEGGGAARA
jgi:hypothetical protein